MFRAFPKVRFKAADNDEWTQVLGREAETLLKLHLQLAKGVRAFDFPGGPAFRLSAYVHALRRLGLKIRTRLEPHEVGHHAVYFLESEIQVEVLAITPAAQPRSAA